MLFEQKRFILFAIITILIVVIGAWTLDIAGIRTIGKTGWLLLLTFFAIGILFLHLGEQVFGLEKLEHIAEINIIGAIVSLLVVTYAFSLSALSINSLLFIAFITPSVSYLARSFITRGQ